jgi:AraC-like DNA-binding protein
MHKLYQPVQPAVTGTNGTVAYHELPADERLQEVIYCYWQLKTTEKLVHPFHYRVVADGCIDIFFELENPNEAYVMGFATRFTEFPLSRSFNYVGIRFLPTAFSRLFSINALELTDRFDPLDSIVPEVADFISQSFNPGVSFQKQTSVLDRYFLNYVRHTSIKTDPRISRALHTILTSYGNLQLSNDLGLGLSPRQLRRLFNRKIGGTVKTFSRIVRFQHILNKAKVSQNIAKGYFFDAGYYDQSHLIKEFNTLYGQSPSIALKK